MRRKTEKVNWFWVAISLAIGLTILYVSIRTQHQQYRPMEPRQEDEPSIVVETPDPSPEPLPTADIKSARASWYGQSVCEGRSTCLTASGEPFEEDELTFASRGIQFGTRVKFCLDDNCVVCRANDRGPFVVGREFDLSRGCADAIGMLQRGVSTVTWEEVKE